jgi:uncharacterized protein YndB with AHSA1/START domain
MKTILWGLLALTAVAALAIGVGYYRLRSASIPWQGPVAEILTERIDKNADRMEVDFTTRIDAPVEAVFQAFSQPERTQEFSDNVRLSRLVSDQDNRKVVEFEAKVLDRPQNFTLEFTFFPSEKRVTFATVENPLADMQGEYRFLPSPDGSKTLLIYQATSRDKASLPIPLSMQKSAAREGFVSLIRALKKSLASPGQGALRPEPE